MDCEYGVQYIRYVKVYLQKLSQKQRRRQMFIQAVHNNLREIFVAVQEALVSAPLSP